MARRPELRPILAMSAAQVRDTLLPYRDDVAAVLDAVLRDKDSDLL